MKTLFLSLFLLLFLFPSPAGAGRILYFEPFPPEGTSLLTPRPPVGLHLLLEEERIEDGRLELDGRECPLKWEGDFLHCRPEEPLAPGIHTYRLTLVFAGPWRPLSFSRTFRVLPGADPSPDPSPPYEELVREEVNRLRGLADLPPLEIHPALVRAARAHAAYCLRHRCWEKGLGAHGETPDTEGFTGERAMERAFSQGYPGYFVAENIHFLADPARAVREWGDSVYHRLTLLEPLAEEIGYGQAGRGDYQVNVLKVGSQNPFRSPGIPERGWNFSSLTVYPARGQREVPLSWPGNEIPDPYRFFSPRSKNGYPYPLTIQLNRKEAEGLSLFSASLEEEGGGEIPLEILVPASSPFSGGHKDEYLNRALALLPRFPLRPCTSYRVRAEVEIRYPERRELHPLSWHFTTRGCPEPAEGKARVSLEGRGISLPALIRGGRSFLPARAFLEALGARVEWDPHRRTVTAVMESGDRLAFKVGFDLAFRGEEEIRLPEPPFIAGDRTYIPVRALASLLGMKVEWREENREVVLSR